MRDKITTRVALIGCEHVDRTGALSLAQCDAVDGLLLIGKGCGRLADELCQAAAKATGRSIREVLTGTYGDAFNADIAVMAAGIGDAANRSPEERLRQTAAKMHETVSTLVSAGFNGVLLVITNPIDIMTHVAQRASGFSPQRVIGLGTGADCAGISQYTVQPPTIWCSAECSNVRFLDNCDPVCPTFAHALEQKRDVPRSKYGYSGNRISSLATCVKQVCETILRDERSVLPVSTLAAGEYGISGVYMTLPCVLGRKGVERIVELPVTGDERQRMHIYAAAIRRAEADFLCPVVGAALH